MMQKIFLKVKNNFKDFYPIPFFIFLIIVISDQWTKYWTAKNGLIYDTIHKVSEKYFHIVHVRNKGAAWGVLDEYTFILALISLIACIYFFMNFTKLSKKKLSLRISFSILMGGIFGNWIDRQFFKEGVIDMFQVFIPVPKFLISSGYYHYPAFNIADSCILIGAISSYIIYNRKERKRI